MTKPFEPRILCVYGTLKRGFHNHYLLGDSEFLGEFQTPESFTMYSFGSFPCILPQGDTSISTEVFRITDRTISGQINRLEGYSGIPNDPSNWYNVMKLDTPWGNSDIFIADEVRGLPIVTSGKW